jgi:hypothetical protein
MCLLWCFTESGKKVLREISLVRERKKSTVYEWSSQRLYSHIAACACSNEDEVPVFKNYRNFGFVETDMNL